MWKLDENTLLISHAQYASNDSVHGSIYFSPTFLLIWIASQLHNYDLVLAQPNFIFEVVFISNLLVEAELFKKMFHKTQSSIAS
jgi:hypothetical protein